MWLFLPSGFYSVIAHRDHLAASPGSGIPVAARVIVRSRERSALDYFAAASAPEHLVEVTVDPLADYPFRAEVPTEVWAAFVFEAAADITATNFKSAVEALRGRDRYTDALHRIWSVMASAYYDRRPRQPPRLEPLPGIPLEVDDRMPDGTLALLRGPDFGCYYEGQAQLSRLARTEPAGVDLRTRSNNGGQTRPLTKPTLAELADIAVAPRPRSSVNAGVVDRLTRLPDPLCTLVDLPSPFKVHKGGTCPHLRITDAGRAALEGR